MIFSERLKQLMQELKISKATLAQAIGYTQRAVSKWLNGQAEPSASVVYACAKFFGVSSDYLLGLED